MKRPELVRPTPARPDRRTFLRSSLAAGVWTLSLSPVAAATSPQQAQELQAL